MLISLLSKFTTPVGARPYPVPLIVQRPSHTRRQDRSTAQGRPGADDHRGEMPSPLPAVTQSPAREVAVARQPVLDGDANLLGYELLVDGAAVVVDALSEVGLDALTGGHVAWLPLGRELLLRVGPVPVRSDRVVLQVPAVEGPDEALFEAVHQLAECGACIVLDDVTFGPAIEPLLDLAWGVKLDLAVHGAEGLREQVAALPAATSSSSRPPSTRRPTWRSAASSASPPSRARSSPSPRSSPAAPSRPAASTSSARSPTCRRASSSRTSSARSSATSASATSFCASPTRRCSPARSGSARCARR